MTPHKVHFVWFSLNGRLLAAACSDSKIRLWDTDEEALVRELKGHADEEVCVAFSSDGTLLASGSAIWIRQIGATAVAGM